MSRRTERVGNLLRNTIAEVLARKISDPRIDPGRTSITRVEVAEDLLAARVFVSVMGAPPEQRNTLRALQHAAGHIQELVTRQVTLRHMPQLAFVADERFKKTMKTLTLIQQAMDEIRQKEQASSAPDAPPGDPDKASV